MQPYGMVPPGSQQQFPGQGGMMGYPMQQGKNGFFVMHVSWLLGLARMSIKHKLQERNFKHSNLAKRFI